MRGGIVCNECSCSRGLHSGSESGDPYIFGENSPSCVQWIPRSPIEDQWDLRSMAKTVLVSFLRLEKKYPPFCSFSFRVRFRGRGLARLTREASPSESNPK